MRGVSHAVANFTFFALFPGFFVYHALLAMGLMPAYFGGLIGNVSMLIAAYCVFLSFWLLRSEFWGGLNASRLFVFAWGFYALWGAVGALVVVGESYGYWSVREVIAMLVYWLTMFFVGSFFRLDGWLSKTAFVVITLSVVTCLLMSVLIYASLLGPLMLFSPDPDAEIESSTYQGAGRSIAITGVVAAAYVPGQWRQLGILALSLIVLLSVGSRVYVVAGAAALAFWVCVAAVRHKQHVALALFVGFAATVGYSVREFFVETRAGELLDLAGSASWQDRLQVQSLAFKAINSSPLLGDFGYHIREMGPGGYAHNALSAWPEFGLLGFLLYVGLIAFFALTAFRRMFSTDPRWQAAVGLNVVTLVVVLGEPVFSLVPALGWGFVVNALLHERRVKRLQAMRPALAGSA